MTTITNEMLQEVLKTKTIYQVNGKIKIGKKRGPKREQVLTSSQFRGTRNSSQELAQASRLAKTIKDALQPYLFGTADKNIFNRMVQLFRKVIKSSSIDSEKRSFNKGNLDLMNEFEFNSINKFSYVLKSLLQYQIDRNTKEVSLYGNIYGINSPKNTTHFKLTNIVLVVDIDEYKTQILTSDTGELPLDVEQHNIEIRTPITVDVQDKLIIQIAKIGFFFTELDGYSESFNKRAMKVVGASFE